MIGVIVTCDGDVVFVRVGDGSRDVSCDIVDVDVVFHVTPLCCVV